MLMLCISVMTLKLFLFGKKSQSKNKKLPLWQQRLSPVWKEILKFLGMFLCPLPLLLFALTRLVKLIVQFMNPGQTVCMKNHLNSEKPPLGRDLYITISCNLTYIVLESGHDKFSLDYTWIYQKN